MCTVLMHSLASHYSSDCQRGGGGEEEVSVVPEEAKD